MSDTKNDQLERALSRMKKADLIELVWDLAESCADDHRHHDMRFGDRYISCSAHNFVATRVNGSLVELGEEDDEDGDVHSA